MWLKQFGSEIQNEFAGNYKSIDTTYISYALWFDENSQSTTCEWKTDYWFGVEHRYRECNTTYYTSGFNEWAEQTTNANFIASVKEKANANKFTDDMIAIKLITSG